MVGEPGSGSRSRAEESGRNSRSRISASSAPSRKQTIVPTFPRSVADFRRELRDVLVCEQEPDAEELVAEFGSVSLRRLGRRGRRSRLDR